MSALSFPGAAMTVMSQPVAAPASVELEVERIRGLLKERRFQQAVSAAAALRTPYPENRDSSTCSPSDSGSRVRSRMPSTRSPTWSAITRVRASSIRSAVTATSRSRTRRARLKRTSGRFRSTPLCRRLEHARGALQDGR